MAFPKKKSRRIIVDNTYYRCMVGPNDGYNFFYAHIDQEEHGRIIEVFFPTDVNKYWVSFPYVSDLNLYILKPKDFELIIRQALFFGWDPLEKGIPMKFQYSDEQLVLCITGNERI